MRRLLLGSTIFLIVGGRALAADYVPEPVELYNWTGFYIGATGGWAFDGELHSEPKDFPFVKFDQRHDGGVVGGFGAARYQFPNQPFVIGAEVTGLKSFIEGEDGFSDLQIFPFVIDTHAKVDSLILAEGQLGVAYDRVLAYLSGGFASADVSLDAHLKIPGLFSEKVFDASNQANGVVVGGGIDYAVPDTNFVLGLSFKHIVFNDLGLSDTFKDGKGGGYSEAVCECRDSGFKINTDSNLEVDQIMGRVSFHF